MLLGSSRWGYALTLACAFVVGCTAQPAEEEDSDPTSQEGSSKGGKKSSTKNDGDGTGDTSGTSDGTSSGNNPPPTDNKGTDAGTTPPTPESADLGQGDGKDVITIGDSYMLQSTMANPNPLGVEKSLAKASGRTYRNYGGTYPKGDFTSPFTKAVAMLNDVIPNEWDKGKTDGKVLTVVVAAGGNDLTQDCVGAATEDKMNAACKKLADDVEARIQKMIGEMAKAGVKDVVWVGYGPMDTAKMQQPKEVNGFLLALRSRRQKNCVSNSPALGLRCWYIDNLKDLTGKIGSDGQHPSAEGYDLMGKKVWDLMQKQGIRR